MRIHSVVVAYRPDHGSLTALCLALRRNASDVVVVDNTDDKSRSRFEAPEECALIPLGRNAGVAEAFNVGIRHALDRGADAIVLFDQDSEIEDGFLARLVRPLRPGTPGVAAPVARDKKTGREYPARRLGRFGGSANIFVDRQTGTEPVAVEIVISSGCAATAVTFSEVGLMDEDFFIDFVDVEWCLRCRQRGVKIVVVPDAAMAHSIGDTAVRTPLGLYRGIIHGPVRTYYKIRNSFLLARKRHVPLLFALHQVFSALAHNVIQLLFVKERAVYLRTILVAVTHGLRGVTGKRAAA